MSFTVSNNNALPIPFLQSPLTLTQTCNTMKSFVTQNAYYRHINSTSYKSAEECIQIILALECWLFSNLSHHDLIQLFLFGEGGRGEGVGESYKVYGSLTSEMGYYSMY